MPLRPNKERRHLKISREAKEGAVRRSLQLREQSERRWWLRESVEGSESPKKSRSRSVSRNRSQEKQRPCMWNELVEVAKSLPLPNVAEEDLADQAVHSTSNNESKTEPQTQSSLSVQLICDDEEERNLQEEVAEIFETNLHRIASLSLQEESTIGLEPETPGRNEYNITEGNRVVGQVEGGRGEGSHMAEGAEKAQGRGQEHNTSLW